MAARTSPDDVAKGKEDKHGLGLLFSGLGGCKALSIVKLCSLHSATLLLEQSKRTAPLTSPSPSLPEALRAIASSEFGVLLAR